MKGMGRGFPPPCKNGCYTLVATEKVGMGSIQEFIVGLVGMHREVWSSLRVSTWDQRQQGIVSFKLVPAEVSPISLLQASPTLFTLGFGTWQSVWRVQPVGLNEHPHH